MKVGICVNDAAGSGIGNYTKELIKNLNDNPEVDVQEIPVPSYSTPVLGPYISSSYGIRKQLKKYEHEVDLFHLPSQTQAAGLNGLEISTPIVVTVHDLIPLVSSYDNLILETFAKIYGRGLKNADRFIAISEYTKRDLINQLGISEDTIEVIYPSVTTEHFQQSASKKAMGELNISEPYILFVGSQTSKKNLKVVIEALQDLPDELSLAVVGDPGLLPGYITKYHAKKYGVSDRVIQTGFVDIETLGSLYDSALAFVFPSNYEGFGRPPLEAMSTGTPVIATSATAVPEIVDDAAILCSPDTPSEWVTAISDLLDNPTLQERFVELGYDRVQQFSWSECVSETINVYQGILKTKKMS